LYVCSIYLYTAEHTGRQLRVACEVFVIRALLLKQRHQCQWTGRGGGEVQIALYFLTYIYSPSNVLLRTTYSYTDDQPSVISIGLAKILHQLR